MIKSKMLSYFYLRDRVDEAKPMLLISFRFAQCLFLQINYLHANSFLQRTHGFEREILMFGGNIRFLHVT